MTAISAVSTLHVITTTARRGAEVFAHDLAEPLRRRNLHVDLIALTAAKDDQGLPVQVLGTQRFGRTTIGALRARMRAADVVIAHGSATLAAAAMAGVGLRTPIIYRSIGDSRAWTTTWHRRVRVRLLLHRAAAVVALWEDAAAAITERYGMPSGRVHVIANAVEAERFRPPTREERTQARRRFGLPDDRPVVAFVGALSEEKNPELAVQAIATLPETTLVIAGEGPRRPTLEALAERHMPGRTRFVGSIEDVTAVYWSADVLMLPSRTEGMPAAPIEAGLCGVPTVAAGVGAVPKIVIDGRTGALFNPGDPETAARKLRTVIESAEALGAAAREHCRSTFSLEAAADAWSELITTVAAS